MRQRAPSGERRGGAFRLHNNTGASQTVERRENAAEGGSRPSAERGIERDGFSLLFFPAFLLLLLLPALLFFSLCTHFLSISLSLFLPSVFCPTFSLVIYLLFFLTYGDLTSLSLSPPSLFTFLSSHLSVSRCEDAGAGGALGPRSQDARLHSRGGSRGLSRRGSPLAGLGASQDTSHYLRRRPVTGPGAPGSHTAAQGGLESSQGRPPGAREKSGERLGGIREGRGRGGEA